MNLLSQNIGSSLHHQVYAVLRSGIVSGRYADGDFLPSEEALTEMFGVSRATIRRAMLSLEQEGLIERRQGRGTRVRRPGGGEPRVTSLASYLETIEQLDRTSTMEVRSLDEVQPPDTPRQALGLGRGETAWRLVRVRVWEGQPLWLIVNYLSSEIGAGLKAKGLAQVTLIEALRRLGHVCDHAEETVGATLADPEVATAISVKIGAPLLELSRILFDAEDQPIAYQLTLIPPERRKLRLILKAEEGGLPETGVFVRLAAGRSERPRSPRSRSESPEE